MDPDGFLEILSADTRSKNIEQDAPLSVQGIRARFARVSHAHLSGLTPRARFGKFKNLRFSKNDDFRFCLALSFCIFLRPQNLKINKCLCIRGGLFCVLAILKPLGVLFITPMGFLSVSRAGCYALFVSVISPGYRPRLIYPAILFCIRYHSQPRTQIQSRQQLPREIL